MIAVGIREFKSKLSAYLRMVRSGEVVLITDRGEVVAELRQPGADVEPTSFPRLNKLIRDGMVRIGSDPPEGLYDIEDRPNLPAGAALELLDELRSER